MTESELKPLVVTEDSYLVLNQLRLDEQGTYRCSLEGRNGIVFYRVLFLLSGKKKIIIIIITEQNKILVQVDEGLKPRWVLASSVANRT